MKKISLLFASVALLLMGNNLKAELPSLTAGPSSPVTLPDTFSLSKTFGEIDIDGDDTNDYFVRFSSYSGDNYCVIYSYNSNAICAEFEGVPAAPSAASSVPALTVSGPSDYFASFMERGELIGPSLSGWRGNANFFDDSNLRLTSNATDGVYSGYVGVYFSGSGNHHYGWMNVEVDPAGNWVKINSAGYNTAANTQIPAGLGDPFAVPVPLIASILGFGLIGGGAFLKRKRKANK